MAETILDTFMVTEHAPQAKQRPRMTRGGHVYTPAETRRAELFIKLHAEAEYALKMGRSPYPGPVHLYLDIVIPRPRTSKRPYPDVKPDLDNYQKLVCDALNEVVWRDDCQVTNAAVAKRYAKPGEKTGFRILVKAVEDGTETKKPTTPQTLPNLFEEVRHG